MPEQWIRSGRSNPAMNCLPPGQHARTQPATDLKQRRIVKARHGLISDDLDNNVAAPAVACRRRVPAVRLPLRTVAGEYGAEAEGRAPGLGETIARFRDGLRLGAGTAGLVCGHNR